MHHPGPPPGLAPLASTQTSRPPTTTTPRVAPPPGLNVPSPLPGGTHPSTPASTGSGGSSREAMHRAAELHKIAKTQIAFKIGGLSEENFAYAQQEIQAVVRQNGADTDLYLFQRLLHASAPSLGILPPPQSSLPLTQNSAASLAISNSAQQLTGSTLAARLLGLELKRLATEPSRAQRWAESIAAALTSGVGGTHSAEEALVTGANQFLQAVGQANGPLSTKESQGLGKLVRGLGLTPWELVVLFTPFVSVLGSSPSQSPLPGNSPALHSPSVPPGLASHVGSVVALTAKKQALAREAAVIVREHVQSATHLLSNSSNAADVEGTPPADLQPVQLSAFLSRIVSDTWIPSGPAKSDMLATTINASEEHELLFSVNTQRAVGLAILARVGAELAPQIATHCLQTADFGPTTAMGILYRMCPDQALCTAELVRFVLAKFSSLSSGESADQLEAEASKQLEELVSLASSSSGELGVEVAAWVRGVGEACPGLMWSQVIKCAFDHPPPTVGTGNSAPSNGGKALPETWGLRFLGQVLSLAPGLSGRDQSESTAAISGVFLQWEHPQTQLSLIDRLLYLPSDSSPFVAGLKPTPLGPMVAAPCHRIVCVEDAQGSSPTIKALAKSVEGSSWNVSELMSSVIKGLEYGDVPAYEASVIGTAGLGNRHQGLITVRDRAGEVLERACKSNPELVIMALVQVERPWGAVHTDLAARLLHSFLTGHPHHQLVFLRLWQMDSNFLLAALRDFYEQDAMNVTRILDIAQDLKILEHLLGVEPVMMTLDMASLASRREYLNLEKWLLDNISSQGSPFMLECLKFLNMKVRYDLERQDHDASNEQSSPLMLTLSAVTVATFLRSLRIHSDAFSQEEIESFKEIRTASIQLYPRLMSFTPGSEQEPGMNVITFDSALEQEVDRYYTKMYSEEISIDQVLADIQRARLSDSTHDQEFVACFLHGLFDEYRFFHTYPPRELQLTATLFGSLINDRLIGYVPLGIAVRYVLDAIRNPPDTNWYRFGVQTLSRFQNRLADWPQLAAAVARVEHLAATHPDVASRAVAVVHGAEVQGQTLNGPEPADLLNGSALGGTGSGGLGGGIGVDMGELVAFTAIRPDAAGEEPVSPEEKVSDKMLFIVNNLAPSNFEAKVVDMAIHLKEEHYSWFARYLVSQRVSIEPNNHSLYMGFLDALKIPPMNKKVLNETFIRCAALLNAEKTVQSPSERTILKNLGAWLGALTLAKDRPIKHRHIAFKKLLEEGFTQRRLIVAIPFVCKVLEQASRSTVFKPPNPWLMAILSLLVELYHFAELKLNLKFEIEVLCKALKVDLQSVQATSTLQNKSLPVSSQDAGTGGVVTVSPFVTSMNGSGVTNAGATLGIGRPNQGSSSAGGGLLGPGGVAGGFSDHLGSARGAGGVGVSVGGDANRQNVQPIAIGGQAGYAQSLQEMLVAALVELSRFMRFSSEIPLNGNGVWRKVVYMAIERAIRDIIGPVVERSVTIASISTRELTSKDFAMDGSEDRLRKAAHLMVQDLAGSLALVTTKEPLRTQIIANIRTLSSQSGFSEQNVSDEEIQQVVFDNLEVACQVVERVATEKAITEVDIALNAAYEARRLHKERLPSNGSQFWDTSAMAASHYSSMLPNQLRLKLGGLDPDQLRIYEDFGVQRVANWQAGQITQGRMDSPTALDDPTLAPALAAAAAKVATRSVTLEEATERIGSMIAEVERMCTELNADNLAQVADDHELHALLAQITPFLDECVTREQAFLMCAQKVVASLYKSTSTVGRELYVALLQHICRIHATVAHEVGQWIIYAEGDRKHNVPVTVLLVTHNVVKISDLDNQYAKLIIRDFRQSVIEFVVEFAHACLLGEPPVATFTELRTAIQALSHAVQTQRTTPAIALMVDELKSKIRANGDQDGRGRADDILVRERLFSAFSEWVRIYSNSYNLEQPFVEFIVVLQGQGVLRGEDISSLFFRVCIEISVDAYIKGKAAGGSVASGIFEPIDAFARLITMMIKYHADPTGSDNDKAKVHYMTKILSIVVLVIAQAHEELGVHFQQKPFFRFFSSLLNNLASMDTHLGASYSSILIALSNSINTLQPMTFPSFALSWMSLISHPMLMPKLLLIKNQEGWSAFHRLILNLLKFVVPFWNKGNLDETTRVLHSGTARVLLVLLHDFPDFLAAYHHSLTDVLPPHCIQLIHVVLSAFPNSARLPDPFAQGLSLEHHPDARSVPAIMSDFMSPLQAADVRTSIDKAVNSNSPHSVIPLLIQRMSQPAAKKATSSLTTVTTSFASAVVLYLGVLGTQNAAKETSEPIYNPESPAARIFKQLIAELDPESRYYTLCCTINQLRWPNVHTVWFGALLLDTFSESTETVVREQVTRVFLERLLVHRPYPFGLQYTFIRLLTLPHLNLLDQPWAQRSEELKALLVNCSLKARKQPV